MLNFTFAFANCNKNKIFIATQIAIQEIVNPCKQVSDFLYYTLFVLFFQVLFV